MNSKAPHAEKELESAFEERIDILFHEIELAVKWDRPSILFAIYKSDSIRDEVNALLGEKLKGISQKTRCIRTDQFDFVSEISELPDLAATVLLIDGFNWECGKEGVRVLTEFNKHREYFLDNNIRAIFWLFEEEVSEFAENATECWILRHRVVEFVDPPQPEPAAEPSLEPLSEVVENAAADETLPDESFEKWVTLAKNNQANASHANALLNLGILGWRKGNPQGALKYLRVAAGIAKFLGNQSLQAQCQNALALAHAELGDTEEAITAYQNAISLSPESGFLWNNLGQLLARTERNEEAIIAYKKALACSPDDFLGWDGLGHIYLKMGLHQNAISAFEKALEIAPYYEFSWSGIGQAYLETGQLEGAIAPLGKAVKSNPHSIEAWKSLGECLIGLERDREAISVYQKAIEFNPQEAVLWRELGRLHLAKQNHVESIVAFHKVVALRPQCGQAKIDLATAHFQMGDYETCAVIYEESIPLFEDQRTRAELLNHLGDTYMHMKEYEKAIAAYEQAEGPKPGRTGSEAGMPAPEPEVVTEEIKDIPSLPESENNEPDDMELVQDAPVEERGDEMNEANQVFDLRTAQEWNELGNSHLKAGAYNDAIIAYTKAIELAADSSWPYIQNLAHVHYQKGKLKGKLAAGQGEEPDVWEGEDDDPDTAALFDMDAIPNPERSDQVGNFPQDLLPTNTFISDPAPTQSTGCCPQELEENTPEVVEGVETMTESNGPQTILPPEPGVEDGQPSTQAVGQMGVENIPHNSIDWNELGNACTRCKKYPEAIEAYKKAIELNPNFGQPYSNLGLIYYHLGKFDTAILLFKKSIDLLETREEKAASWNKLGDSYRRLGDYGNALAAYQKSSEMAPPLSPVMARARATLLENIVVG